MKLAFSTLGCPDWSLKYAVEQAAELGFQAIEIRGIREKLRADTIDELLPEKRQDMLDYAREKGVEFCCLGASSAFHDSKMCEACTEEALAAVRLACECKIPYVRVFGNNLITDDEQTELAEIARKIRYVCLQARKFNVTVLLEVHGDFNTSDRIISVAEEVSCDNFGIIWDIQHSREEPSRFWHRTKHLIRHVHIKDSINGVLCNTGEGELPVEEIVRMLEEDGYDGYFSIEWEKRWHPELRDAREELPSFAAFMKKIGKG